MLNKEINVIVNTLKDFKIESLVFVNEYKFDVTQEQQMMSRAMAEIENCDLLVAETSEKGIGIGIEVGYAKAHGKKIIYLRQKKSDHSTTVSGISDFKIIYTGLVDLRQQLSNTLNKL